MTPREWIEAVFPDEDILLADGFDDELLGVAQRYDQTIAVYDQEAVVAKLQSQGMTYDEAIDYYGYNIVGSWMGEGTPAFLIRRPKKK